MIVSYLSMGLIDQAADTTQLHGRNAAQPSPDINDHSSPWPHFGITVGSP
jgi:hypothetical protein